MKTIKKTQRGFLLIVGIILIVVIAFIGVTLAYLSSGSSTMAVNTAEANAALYIAKSGLEIATRNIIINGIECTAINGNTTYTNASLYKGKNTVTGYDNSAFNSLAGIPAANAIDASSTTIPLAAAAPTATLNNTLNSSLNAVTVSNTSAFTPRGIIQIDKELIYYSGISGNTFTGVIRGVAGSIAAAHTAGATIYGGLSSNGVISIDNEIISYSGINYTTNSLLNARRGVGNTLPVAHNGGTQIFQKECILTSQAAIPTFTNPNAERTVQQVLFKSRTGFNVGGYAPAISSLGSINMNGNSVIYNNTPGLSCPTSADFSGAGSTIVTSYLNGVSFNGFPNTYTVVDGSVCSQSHPGNLMYDVIYPSRSSISLSTDSMWNSYFTVALSILETPPNTAITLDNKNSSANGSGNGNTQDINFVFNTIANTTYPVGSIIVLKGQTGGYSVGINGSNLQFVLGSPTNPIVLIIDSPNGLTVGGTNNSVTVYGLIYFLNSSSTNITTQLLKVSGSNTFTVNGAIAVAGSIDINGNNNIILNSSIISLIADNPQLNVGVYVHSLFNSREIIY